MTFLRLYWLASALLGAGVPGAVRYLEDEVPRWRAENGCYSCHNNGDGARALFAAGRRGKAVEDTVAYLLQPSRWEEPKPLARVQYAAALLAARKAGLATDDAALRQAAALLAKDQSPDGHFQVDEEKVEGSPVTYGPAVATWLAAPVLREAGLNEQAARAEAYVQRAWAAADLLARQAPNGSWNSEPYDTAVAILRLKQEGRGAEAIIRGRRYLLSTQLSAGGWAATTRPPGGHSYAQHISTTAWALLALLATQ